MKPKEIVEELMELARSRGISVRKETGSFRGGYCIVNASRLIVINKTTPIETLIKVLSQSLIAEQIDNHYLKPAVRDLIDREKLLLEAESQVELVVN